eukprot:TRINITY_DN1215_c0_g1_i1.p1 TRINITY_DN1215_c0_g1~~TRINITY_DN1215_c0_g1_i1.p1  ORF type:complete len:195 (+),score=67.76 TRINITY_DN1215_c0_g1_i1:68-652(+)
MAKEVSEVFEGKDDKLVKESPKDIFEYLKKEENSKRSFEEQSKLLGQCSQAIIAKIRSEGTDIDDGFHISGEALTGHFEGFLKQIDEDIEDDLLSCWLCAGLGISAFNMCSDFDDISGLDTDDFDGDDMAIEIDDMCNKHLENISETITRKSVESLSAALDEFGIMDVTTELLCELLDREPEKKIAKTDEDDEE